MKWMVTCCQRLAEAHQWKSFNFKGGKMELSCNWYQWMNSFKTSMQNWHENSWKWSPWPSLFFIMWMSLLFLSTFLYFSVFSCWCVKTLFIIHKYLYTRFFFSWNGAKEVKFLIFFFFKLVSYRVNKFFYYVTLERRDMSPLMEDSLKSIWTVSHVQGFEFVFIHA